MQAQIQVWIRTSRNATSIAASIRLLSLASRCRRAQAKGAGQEGNKGAELDLRQQQLRVEARKEEGRPGQRRKHPKPKSRAGPASTVAACQASERAVRTELDLRQQQLPMEAKQ